MSWIIPLALLLDLLFADPKKLPHPVQGIGALAAFLEPKIRAACPPLAAGALALCLVLAATGCLAFAVTSLPSGFGIAMSLYLAWSGLALGGLVREGKRAVRLIALAEKVPSEVALQKARAAVRMLVSRDTSAMDVPNLYRSLAESMSENINDAFTAPLFWLIVGGPVGLWLYKAVSTLDSMWGYTTPRWLLFGRAAAKLDDALAFVPARLSVALMFLTVWANRLGATQTGARPDPPAWPGWAVFLQQARSSASPNAGWPMAAAAWLFQGKSGGPTIYGGALINKPLLGPQDGSWRLANTRALIGHIRLCGVLLCPGLFLASLLTS